MVEVADERHLLQDVLLHARDAVEEEEGEDAGGSAEGGADGAPVRSVRMVDWKGVVVGWVSGFLHPDESGGSEAAELDFGDFVAGEEGVRAWRLSSSISPVVWLD